jgi:hypothetical protein
LRDVTQQDDIALDLISSLRAGDGALEDGPDFPKRAGTEDLRLGGKPLVYVVRREVAELACAQGGDDVRVREDGALRDGLVVPALRPKASQSPTASATVYP